MKREQLEHIIRAACSIADDDEIIIMGSQAILAQYPDPPADLVVSMEADVYPKHWPARAELIEGSIGELSMFHETFGYYADGIGQMMPTLPNGWEDRLVAIRGPGTSGKTGWALEVHDLVISKYIANREKDRLYNRAVPSHGLARSNLLRERLASTSIDDDQKARIAAQIDADSSAPGKVRG